MEPPDRVCEPLRYEPGARGGWAHGRQVRGRAVAASLPGALKDRVRTTLRQTAAVAREAATLRSVPPRVALFYVRAWITALRSRDRFTLDSASRPSDVAGLLALARGHTRAVELGTGTAWTTIALALADEHRRIESYDPEVRTQRERYLRLVPESARSRIDLRAQPAEAGRPDPASVGFLFIDCAHDRETTVAAFRAWEAAVRPGGVVAFHDYDHPRYPGVRDAVRELGLPGVTRNGVFVWQRPAAG
jgi:predicted O-methyltransferase YrrM